MLTNLLTYRFLTFNIIMAVLTAFLANKWAVPIWEGDLSRISLVIVAGFVIGLIITAIQITKTTKALNAYNAGRAYEMKGQKRVVRLGALGFLSGGLMTLGLIGTVFGFIVALSGVDDTSMSSVGGVQSMASQLIQGIHIALYTTAVGAYFSIWTKTNHYFLYVPTKCLAMDEEKVMKEWKGLLGGQHA